MLNLSFPSNLLWNLSMLYLTCLLLLQNISASLREESPYSEFSTLFFPAFRLNTEIYRVRLCIQSKCEKLRTRKNPDTETFYLSPLLYFKSYQYIRESITKFKVIITSSKELKSCSFKRMDALWRVAVVK